jgi:prepilin-type N-terminal cleavage/methylation domain-containing protein
VPRRSLRLLRRSGGYTIIEVVVVMLILAIIVGALSTAFVSGARSEFNANQLYQAQQNARLALDRLRTEIHCASSVSSANGVAVATITITLPSACPGTDATVTWATQLVSTNRYRLTRAGVEVADYVAVPNVFTYYVPVTGTLGRLHVDLPVNLSPSQAFKEWRLVDDIVLRNTLRPA